MTRIRYSYLILTTNYYYLHFTNEQTMGQGSNSPCSRPYNSKVSKSCSHPGPFHSKNQRSAPLPLYFFSLGKRERFGETTSKDALKSDTHGLWTCAHPRPKVVDVTERKVGSLSQTHCPGPPGERGRHSRGWKVRVTAFSVYSAPE